MTASKKSVTNLFAKMPLSGMLSVGAFGAFRRPVFFKRSCVLADYRFCRPCWCSCCSLVLPAACCLLSAACCLLRMYIVYAYMYMEYACKHTVFAYMHLSDACVYTLYMHICM